tara:strand:- start:8 stop:697 length:690 start_codon:yes stop_codon:yes gene_type:complete
MRAPRFTPKALSFLRQLKHHNNREWFQAHRNDYEQYVRLPMVDLVERLAVDLRIFAPDLVAAPKTSIYRIYRDTRFSVDKVPYKTHVAAIFPHRDLPKHEGAGLYVHVAPDHVLIGGGLYRPTSRQLYRLREHIATNARRLRTIVESPRFRRSFGELSGGRLQRVPRGFDSTHPAVEYLRLKQFLAGTERPANFATGPRFYTSVLKLFRQLAPFIHYVNEPLVGNEFRI